MWIYEKKLQFPVKITRPDARMAKIMIEQYGGANCFRIYIKSSLSAAFLVPHIFNICLHSLCPAVVSSHGFLPQFPFDTFRRRLHSASCHFLLHFHFFFDTCYLLIQFCQCVTCFDQSARCIFYYLSDSVIFRTEKSIHFFLALCCLLFCQTCFF